MKLARSLRFAPIACTALILKLAVCGQIQEQTNAEQEKPLRLKSDLVQVQAVVTDKRGRLIEDLKQEDFEVLENDKPQALSFFSLERVGGPATKPDSQSIKITIDRAVVMFVDTLNMSPTNLQRTKDALKRFINGGLSDRDTVALITSGGGAGIFQQFTRDRNLISYGIDRLTPARWGRESSFTPLIAASVFRGDQNAFTVAKQIMTDEEHQNFAGLSEAIVRQIVEGKASEVISEASYRRKSALSTLSAVVKQLAEMPAQRLIIFVSDGFSLTDVRGGTDNFGLHSVVSRASRAGIVVHAIDAKGLEPPAEASGVRRTVTGDSRTMGLLSGYLSSSRKESQDGMNSLAKDTGGETYFDSNGLADSMRKALDSSRIYYALSYYPSDDKDTRFRRITVRVKNHSDYDVRAQKGYSLADLKKDEVTGGGLSTEQRLFAAIAGPLPVTEIPIITSADYMEVASDTSQVSVQTQISGATLSYPKQGSAHALELELAILVFDKLGNTVSTYKETLKGNLAETELPTAKRSGFRHAKRLQLKPGFYQVRVGVIEPSTNHIGTAASWVEIPNPVQSGLILSNILLSDMPEDPAATSSPGTGQPFNPLGLKLCKTNGYLAYYLLAYNTTTGQGDPEPTIQAAIFNGNNTVYESQWAPLSSRTIGKDGKGVQIGGRLFLPIDPGIYELRITVKGPKQSAQRSAPFAIEQ
ncbi:MAG TPA: VWA domain-containing protein [Blastocatellia bacterium]|nr:VWA domain-containing protein [Blastocatellia bacterium]